MLYACRGAGLRPGRPGDFASLMEGARALAKQYHGYVIKIDPDVPLPEYPVSGNAGVFWLPADAGGKNFEGIQPKFVFRMNVAGKTEEEMLASFTQKHRYNIRLAVKKGGGGRVCGQEMVPEFTRIMIETGMRDHFVTRK